MKNKSIKIIIVTGILFFSLGILVLFLPIFTFKNSQEKELKKTINLEYLEIVSYNPFNLKLRQYIKLDDPSYWIIEEEYKRTGLFSFSPVDARLKSFEEMNLTRIDANNLTEAKNKFKSQKLGEKTNEEKLIEDYNKEKEKPSECQRLIEIKDSFELSSFSDIKVGDSIREGFLSQADGKISRDTNKKYFLGIKVEKDSIIRVNFYLGDKNPSLNPNPENLKISSAVVVTQTCQTIPVPTKPDGTFDFDLALSKI